MSQLKPIAAACCLLFSLNAYAEPADNSAALPTSEATVDQNSSLGIKLNDVVVTATKTDTAKKDLPFAVSVITQKQIEQRLPNSVPDILRQEAGVDVGWANPFSIATVGVRGALGRTQVLIDGQPADFTNGGLGVMASIQAIDPANVARIEIVRGAGSALYGSNAIGGVINIITKKGDPVKPEHQIYAGADSLGSYWTGFAASGGSKDGRFAYRLDGKYLNYGGYIAIPEPTIFGQLSLGDSTKRDVVLGGRMDYWISEKNRLAVYFNSLKTRRNVSGHPATDSPDYEPSAGLILDNWLSDQYLLSLSAGWRGHRSTMNFDAYHYPRNQNTVLAGSLKENADKYSIELKNQWDVTPGHRLLFGMQYVRDNADVEGFNAPSMGGTPIDTRSGRINNIGLYLQDEMRFGEKWKVTAGLRHDIFDYNLSYQNHIAAQQTDRSINKRWNATTPRLGMHYQFSEKTGLRASVGKGFNAPSASGLMGGARSATYDSRPNPNLDAEKSISADFGLDHDFGDGLQISSSVYYTRIKDAFSMSIINQPNQTIYENINLGEISNRGLELEIKKQFGTSWHSYLNYTYNLSRTDSAPPSNVIGWPCKGCINYMSPKNKLTFGISYSPSERWSAYLNGRYTSSVYASYDSQNLPKNKLSGYFVADMGTNVSIPVGKNHAELLLGINNITNKRYATRFAGWYDEPRKFYAQIGYRF